MATYFISDLHLQPSQPKLAEGFRVFIEKIRADAQQLFILGDFFDSWIGDDEDDPFYVDTVNFLKSLVDDGIAVFFQHGNRDFLIGESLSKKTGIEILPEMKIITLAGKQVLLMHGDSLCTADKEYMAFRAQVRNPAWQAQVMSTSLDQRRQLAAQIRTKSINSNKAEDITDVSPKDVSDLFENNAIDILLHGHTHRPARHTLADQKERIVLGDWGDTGWYVKADDHSIDLIEFSL